MASSSNSAEEIRLTALGRDPSAWTLVWSLWNTIDLPWKKSLPNGPRGLGAQEALGFIEEHLKEPITVHVLRAERLPHPDRELLRSHQGKVRFQLHEEPPIAWPGPFRRGRR
ncbi:MAG: hypothetical protein QW057_00985 [Candidatus Bathyarchaeia archaeon]